MHPIASGLFRSELDPLLAGLLRVGVRGVLALCIASLIVCAVVLLVSLVGAWLQRPAIAIGAGGRRGSRPAAQPAVATRGVRIVIS